MTILTEVLHESMEAFGQVNAQLLHDGGTLDDKRKYQVCPCT
jgi:hypothetical protein